MIEVHHLVKSYGKGSTARRAVDDISFAVVEGSFFALLGGNGAGKTTTVRCMCGLLSPDGGKICYPTETGVCAPREYRSYLGLSPQENAIGTGLTVEENLTLLGELYQLPKVTDSVSEMLHLFGLTAERQKRGKDLSGGLGRRLSIAMALLSRPRVLFLDEPTLGLDVLARRELWEILRSLKGNTTVIMTTHYMEEAQVLADRIAVMDKGKLCAIGTLPELRESIGLPTDASLEDVFIRLTTPLAGGKIHEK